MLQLQTTNVQLLGQLRLVADFLQVAATYQKMRELTVYVMGKEERGKLNIFVVSILSPEISHNNKQKNQNRDSYIQTVSIADNGTLGLVTKQLGYLTPLQQNTELTYIINPCSMAKFIPLTFRLCNHLLTSNCSMGRREKQKNL